MDSIKKTTQPLATDNNQIDRRQFIKLSLEERKRILEEQAEIILKYYEEVDEWRELEIGDLIDE